MAKGVLADELSNYPYIACVTGVSVGFSARSRSFLPFGAQKLGRREKLFRNSAWPKSEKCFKRAENPTETLALQTLLLYVTLKAVASSLFSKARLSAKSLIWKSFLFLMQIKLIFPWKVLHLASFWKEGFCNSEMASMWDWYTACRWGWFNLRWATRSCKTPAILPNLVINLEVVCFPCQVLAVKHSSSMCRRLSEIQYVRLIHSLQVRLIQFEVSNSLPC